MLNTFLWITLIYLAASTQARTICDRDEQYFDSTLSPICDANCQDLNRNCTLTTNRAVAGCYCRRGYARDLQQRCISTNECAMDCFPNEHPIWPNRLGCENHCALIENAATVFKCYTSNEMKCVCIANYCRNQNGQCVPRQRE